MIHEIVFHGKGGYDWSTVYNMPIWLRKFTFTKIKDWYDEETNAHKNKSSKSNTTNIDWANPNKSQIPNKRTISPPTYIAKASKK